MTTRELPEHYLAQLQPAENDTLFVTLSTQTAKAMLKAKNEDIVAVANAYADMAIEALKQQTPALDQGLSCKQGCHHCCYLPVKTTTQVIEDMCRAILSTMSKSDVDSLVSRLHNDIEKRKAPDYIHPCALLSNEGTCLIYENRPMSCRTFTSYDNSACKQSLNDNSAVLQQPLRVRVYESITVAMQALSQQQNEVGVQVDLAPSLLDALTKTDLS